MRLGSANLYTSEDNGRTWLNLTGFNNRSVIGGGFSALAISPANPQEISAANQFGVWRSLDGGLSWQGLNEDLPNLMVRKLMGRRTVALADGTLVEVGRCVDARQRAATRNWRCGRSSGASASTRM